MQWDWRKSVEETTRGYTNSWKTWPLWKLLLSKIVQENASKKNERYWTDGQNTALSQRRPTRPTEIDLYWSVLRPTPLTTTPTFVKKCRLQYSQWRQGWLGSNHQLTNYPDAFSIFQSWRDLFEWAFFSSFFFSLFFFNNLKYVISKWHLMCRRVHIAAKGIFPLGAIKLYCIMDGTILSWRVVLYYGVDVNTWCGCLQSGME